MGFNGTHSRCCSDSDWDFNWADVGWIRELFDRMHFDDHQRINHFRNHYEISRKDLVRVLSLFVFCSYSVRDGRCGSC